MKKLQNKKKKSGFGKQQDAGNDLNWRNREDAIGEEVSEEEKGSRKDGMDEDLDDLEKMDSGVDDNYYNQIITDDDDNI